MGLFVHLRRTQDGNIPSSSSLSVDELAKVYASAIRNIDAFVDPEDMPEWKLLTPWYRQRVKQAWENARYS